MMAAAVTHKKEPLVRIARRESMPMWKGILIRVIAVIGGLILSGIIIYLLTGASPFKVYESMLQGAFGSNAKNFSQKTWITVRDTMMLLCIAVGLAPAFKMKFWNIGAEGQVLVGGIATAACMIYLKNLPTPLLLLAMVCSSLIAGGIWGFFPGLFKARWNTNETLFTLMMNYIAIQLTSYFVALWENPFGSNSVGVINSQGKQGWLPNLLSEGYNKDFGWNVIIVLLVTLLMYLYMNHS